MQAYMCGYYDHTQIEEFFLKVRGVWPIPPRRFP